jgi:hypothetical protein
MATLMVLWRLGQSASYYLYVFLKICFAKNKTIDVMENKI